MNRNQLILILFALLVLGTAGLILVKRNKDSWAQPEAQMGDKIFPNFQPNAVAAIHIKGNSEVHLTHTGELWRVQERWNYPANFHQISDMLIKLKSLKVVEAERVGPEDFGRVNLNEPGKGAGSGTLVEFLDAQGKMVDSLLVGRKHMHEQNDAIKAMSGADANGCYILLPRDPTDVMLISDPLSSMQAAPEAWISRDFIKIEKPASISLVSSNGEPQWKISRESESGSWTLANARPDETLDTMKVSSMAEALTAPRFIDVFPGSNAPADANLQKPMQVVFTTFDHFTYTVQVGGKSPDGNYYLTVAVAADLPNTIDAKLVDKLKGEQQVAGWIYTMGPWILDPLLSDRSQILQGSVAAEKPSEPEPPATSDSPASLPADTRQIPTDGSWRPRVIK